MPAYQHVLHTFRLEAFKQLEQVGLLHVSIRIQAAGKLQSLQVIDFVQALMAGPKHALELARRAGGR